MKVAVINFSGNTGKSTLTKHLLVPQIPGAKRISIENLNEGDGASDVEIGAGKFKALAAELNAAGDDENFVIDIGSSNSKAMLEHFGVLRSTRRDIDFWVVPVVPVVKQGNDTLNTVDALLAIGVEPSRVVVIANNIGNVDAFEEDFERISRAAEALGFSMCEQAVLESKIFDMLKGGNQSVFEIAAADLDLKALRKQFRDDVHKLEEIGRHTVTYDMSVTAAENLRAVFEATPIAAALAETATAE